MSPEREQAELLLRKALEDQAVVVALVDDPTIADAAIGFHAQQAVERAVKSVLALGGYDFPWTHDVQLLLRRLEKAGVNVPAVVREGRRLTPWAVEFRYGETIDDPLDREGTVRLVDAVVAWAATRVRA